MILNVKVRTSKPETKIVSQDGNNLVVDVASAPENGKANQELLKLLKRHFKSQVRIVKGFTSGNKIVEINNSK